MLIIDVRIGRESSLANTMYCQYVLEGAVSMFDNFSDEQAISKIKNRDINYLRTLLCTSPES